MYKGKPNGLVQRSGEADPCRTGRHWTDRHWTDELGRSISGKRNCLRKRPGPGGLTMENLKEPCGQRSVSLRECKIQGWTERPGHAGHRDHVYSTGHYLENCGEPLERFKWENDNNQT